MYWITPNWTWTLNSQKCSRSNIYLPNFGPFCSMRYKVVKKLEMHRMTPNWTWTLHSQSTPYTLNTYLWGQNFGPFRSMMLFQKYTVVKKLKMHWMTPNWSCTLNSKSILHIHKVLPPSPNFSPSLSMGSRFRNTRSSKSLYQKCTKWPHTEL